MRRFAIIFAGVVLFMLVSGLIVSTFMIGGKGFVGLPAPIVQWPLSLPPIPGGPSIQAGPDFSVVGLGIDLVAWTILTLVVQRLARSLRARRRGAHGTS